MLWQVGRCSRCIQYCLYHWLPRFHKGGRWSIGSWFATLAASYTSKKIIAVFESVAVAFFDELATLAWKGLAIFLQEEEEEEERKQSTKELLLILCTLFFINLDWISLYLSKHKINANTHVKPHHVLSLSKNSTAIYLWEISFSLSLLMKQMTLPSKLCCINLTSKMKCISLLLAQPAV